MPSHVGVAGNDRADELARSSIETLDVCALSIPRADYKLHVKKLIRERWKASWAATQNNKLHESLPVIPKKYVSSHPRAWSCKLARLQMGHTNLTHSYLMARDPRPYCEDCIVPLTVRHLLVECPSLSHFRGVYGCPGPPQLRDVFASRNCGVGGPLYTFLNAAGIFNEI